MTFLSSLRSRVASFAAACAVLLSISNVPLPTEAATLLADRSPLAQFATRDGEQVSFNRLSDGSIVVVGLLKASSAPSRFRHAPTPSDLYNAFAPGQPMPSTLIEGNANYLKARGAVSSLHRVNGSYKVAQGPGPRLRPQIANQAWFNKEYCNPRGASYSSCYTPAWNWAYLNSSGDSYGHAVVYAINAPLKLTVNGVGTWSVPTGWIRWVAVYGFLFNFEASVSNAQYFDFESDVVYTF